MKALVDLAYEPRPAIALKATRVLLALTGLWMLLSRAGLVAVLSFPANMWDLVRFTQRVRFGYVLPYSVELVLYGAAHVALLAAIAGVVPHLSCLAAGLLLYHFAPLESILWTTNPYLRGFTIPVLGLLVVAFAQRPDDESPRSDYGWPVFLVRCFFCSIYFFAGYSKLFATGIAWLRPDNIRHHLLGLNQTLGYPSATLATATANHPLLCGALAILGVLFDLVFPAVLVWPKTRWILIPMAGIFHLGNVILFHIAFQNAVLLLLFIDWGTLRRDG